MIHHVKNKEEFDKILKESGDKLVVVDFTAVWCGPCRMMASVFEGVSEDPANKNVVFLKVDVDEVQDLASKYQVRSVPTLLFFKNEELMERLVGAIPAAELNKRLAL